MDISRPITVSQFCQILYNKNWLLVRLIESNCLLLEGQSPETRAQELGSILSTLYHHVDSTRLELLVTNC